jgi:hypothetical protein
MRSYRFISKDETWDGFMDKYEILFSQKSKPMSETCMCWGIECPIGWKGILTNLCDKLEFLNVEYGKKYGFKITASQVKEKFGTLRFYYSITSVIKNPFSRLMVSILSRVSKLAYLCSSLADKNSDQVYKPSLQSSIGRFSSNAKWKFYNKNYDAKTVISFITDEVDKSIQDAESLTYETCARCGCPLDKSNRVETKGWITYICKECDSKSKEKEAAK